MVHLLRCEKKFLDCVTKPEKITKLIRQEINSLKKCMMKIWFICFGLLGLFQPLFSQTYEEWVKQERAQYDRLAKETNRGLEELQKDYDNFVKQRDQEFAEFLKQRWTEFEIFKGNLPRRDPEPKIAPVAEKHSRTSIVELQTTERPAEDTRLIAAPLPRVKKSIQKGYPLLRFDVNFYGNRLKLGVDQDLCMPFTGKLTETAFADYWLRMSRTNYDDLLDRLFGWKEQLGLNDWGYYMLLGRCAEIFVKDENSRQLLIWFLMNKSGYSARIGYGGGEVAVLLPAVQDIFFLSFIVKDGVRYYITRPLNKSLYTYDKNFSGSNRCPDLRFSSSLNFSTKLSGKRLLNYKGQEYTISYNQGVTAFFKDYPSTELNVYFETPLSATLKESIEENFRSVLQPMSQEKRVEWILGLLQQAFPYRTDEEQFGHEKYFFSEEMFFYPYSDCEDRAVLFSRLVDMLTGLPGIGLSYPGHVAAAVKLPEEVKGDYVKYGRELYTVCDPTYMGAGIGRGMPEFIGKRVDVIPVMGRQITREREDRIAALIDKAGGTILNRSSLMQFAEDGNVYVAGIFEHKFEDGSKRFVVPAKNRMIFVAKVDNQNRFEWVLPLGGKGVNMPHHLKIDGNRILLSGTFEKDADFGGIRLQAKAGSDLFTAGIAPEGKVMWASGAGLQPNEEKTGFNYIVRFGKKGEVLQSEIQPDAVGSFLSGIYITRKEEVVVAGAFNRWTGIVKLAASNKQKMSVLNMPEQLKELTDDQVNNQTDKGLAGLLAVIAMIQEHDTPVSGLMALQALDQYNPTFKTRCPAIYKNIGKIEFIRGEEGIIQMKTQNGKAVNFDKVQVKDGSRMRVIPIAGNDLKVEIIDGIQVGKAFIWFRLNEVTLKRQTGDMIFDYDKDHTLRTFNMSRDILN